MFTHSSPASPLLIGAAAPPTTPFYANLLRPAKINREISGTSSCFDKEQLSELSASIGF